PVRRPHLVEPELSQLLEAFSLRILPAPERLRQFPIDDRLMMRRAAIVFAAVPVPKAVRDLLKAALRRKEEARLRDDVLLHVAPLGDVRLDREVDDLRRPED